MKSGDKELLHHEILRYCLQAGNKKAQATTGEVLGQDSMLQPAFITWLRLESRLAIKIARWEDKCITQCGLRNKLLCSQVPAASAFSGSATARCQTLLKEIARSLLFIHSLIQPLPKAKWILSPD